MQKKIQIAKVIVKRLNKMRMNRKTSWKYSIESDGMIWASYRGTEDNSFVLDGFINRLPELVKNPAAATTILAEYKLPGHPHVDLIKDFLLDPEEYLELIKS